MNHDFEMLFVGFSAGVVFVLGLAWALAGPLK